ncbi:hypothetical protein BY996DRAFT_6537162 [Phakopsora pachyrhizi]|uniref:Uncharacterized protein n=1 Tax=Phakopsora pachyrhizi TaxID=170000 RepID=A0AAV0AQJ4_PHAPC|nr:hypothetical protein BY996DRAFT_6537162 [Phakopsora pachyrhizi]CAH7671278.1 hypothetical protein PPACK8108_LOCUS6045 [Phakopsora pachyrhizi]
MFGIWSPDLNIESRIFQKLRTSSVKESSWAIKPSPTSTNSQSQCDGRFGKGRGRNGGAESAPEVLFWRFGWILLDFEDEGVIIRRNRSSTL